MTKILALVLGMCPGFAIACSHPSRSGEAMANPLNPAHRGGDR
ncbi:hypothetical protein [Coleofasciculus sp.]